MGYIHYWQNACELDDEAWTDITAAVKRIITLGEREVTKAPGYSTATFTGHIKGPDGRGMPEFSQDHIFLNGDAPDFDHESFAIYRARSTEFCKTARKPYDLVVTACLAYLAAYHGFEVSSDGDAEDWVAGVRLADNAVGKPVPNPMIVNALAGST